MTYALGVPATSRPSVLRTFPSLHARDVELSAKVIAFFSEPIAAGSLSASGVRLSTNGVVVPASLAFADTQHLAITLTPTAQLSPSTSYSIGFTDALQNVDGQSPATPPVVDFTVGTSTSGPPPGQVAFSSLAPNSTLQIFLMNADGTNVTPADQFDRGRKLEPGVVARRNEDRVREGADHKQRTVQSDGRHERRRLQRR